MSLFVYLQYKLQKFKKQQNPWAANHLSKIYLLFLIHNNTTSLAKKE